MKSSASPRLRLAAGFSYFGAMLLAGGFVYWLHREQVSHATPPAIAISVAIASLGAGALGWLLGNAYVNRERRTVVTILAPAAVLFGAALIASVSYHFAEAALNPSARQLALAPVHAAGNIALAALAYVVHSAPVWVVSLPAASLFVRRLAVAHGI